MSKKEDNKQDNVLEDSIASLEKQFGKGIITNLENGEVADIDWVSTGHIKLDQALGKGIPRGRIIEIYGAASSGKSTLALAIIKQFQDLGEKAAYIDSEFGYDKNYAEKCGVINKDIIFCQPDYTEQALGVVETLVESGKIGVIVVDSVASMAPKVEVEGEIGDSHMGLQARLMSQTFRRLTSKINKSNTTVIFINQTRMKIGVMYGSPETTTGGQALGFYASIRIKLSRIGTNKKGDEVLATNVKAVVTKNKVAPPYKEALFDIYFDSGVCRVSDLIEVGVERNILKKSGAWYSYKDKNIAQGKEKLRELLKENKELFDEIKQEVIK